MHFSQLVRSAAACVLAAVLLCPTASASYAKSSDVVSAALAEVGTEEGPGEYSKYGEWYGLPHSYWCDMFVSWCAMKGNVPTSKFPRHCACTEHVKRFVQMGRYQESAARGGSYIPQQGDVIFFYNNTRYPSGSVKNHTGIVLYVEDGYVYTIEGNALANRLDLPYSVVSEARDGDLEPPDYVTVNRYPLTEPRIHGYGIPAYDDRTPLPLEGFVDLGRHKADAAVFQTLCDEGVMYPTSLHTFSPNHGMTRGEFVQMTANFFGLLGCDLETAAFDDVPAESDYYSAVMSARSAGLVSGATENDFLPDRYVTPAAAQTILNRALTYVGLEEREFTFTSGDYSYIVSTYTIRADIARAFAALSQELPLSKSFDGMVLLNDEVQTWFVRCLDGAYYIPAEMLEDLLNPDEETEDLQDSEEEQPEEPETPAEKFPIPMAATDRVLLTTVPVQIEEDIRELSGFTYRGMPYVSLSEAMELLDLDMEVLEDNILSLTVRSE